MPNVERTHRPVFVSWGMAMLLATALTACGGGGGSEGSDPVSEATTTSQAVADTTASDTAADAVVVASDALSVVDTAVVTAQSVVLTQSLAGGAPVVIFVPVACPGGGSALLSISGGTVDSVANGQLDAGETYALQFTDCRLEAASVALNGSLLLTVDALSGDEAALSMNLESLSAQQALGTVTLNGRLQWQGSRSVASSTGVPTGGVSSRLTTDQLAVTTVSGSRTGSFELRTLDIAREVFWANGLPTSSAMNGRYVIAATHPRNSFEASVTTSGTTQFDADGVPSAGSWQLSLASWAMQMTVSGETVTLAIDQGNDGTVDRTFTHARPQLVAEAG